MARGFQVPKSSTKISDIVLKYGKSIKEKIAEELAGIRSQCFSLTFDEWISVKNRRYVCLNLHIQRKFWNLWLIRVHRSLSAESCVELINKRLIQYGLNIDRDIIRIITDDASVMQNLGWVIKCHQQLCFAHAIQLGVIDVLYKKKHYIVESPTNITHATETDSDDEIEENTDGFEIIKNSDDIKWFNRRSMSHYCCSKSGNFIPTFSNQKWVHSPEIRCWGIWKIAVFSFGHEDTMQ